MRITTSSPKITSGMGIGVQRQSWLFSELLFCQMAERFRLQPTQRRVMWKGLQRLKSRWAQGIMRCAGKIGITEAKAQQEFNRVIFGEVLGYSSLLGDQMPYSLLPEVSFGPRRDSSRVDVAVGWFSLRSDNVIAVVELKDPGQDLERPQYGDQYKSKITLKQLSPIGQALEALERADVDWVMISNIESMCLIHSSNTRQALWVNLLEMEESSLSRFYFAFGLGGFIATGTGPSRLDELRFRAERMRKG